MLQVRQKSLQIYLDNIINMVDVANPLIVDFDVFRKALDQLHSLLLRNLRVVALLLILDVLILLIFAF